MHEWMYFLHLAAVTLIHIQDTWEHTVLNLPLAGMRRHALQIELWYA